MSLLPILRVFLSSSLGETVQSRILRSPPFSHEPRGSGGARKPSCTCGCRERKQGSAAFPAPSPPLCPAPPPPLEHGGHRTRRFWKVSLKARGSRHGRIGAQQGRSVGNWTRRKSWGQPGMQPGLGAGPLESGASCPAALAGPVGEEMDGAWGMLKPDSGCRCGHYDQRLSQGACGHWRGLARLRVTSSKCSILSLLHLARSVSATGCPGRSEAEPGVRGCGRNARLEPLSSQPVQALPGAASGPASQWSALPAIPRRSLKER